MEALSPTSAQGEAPLVIRWHRPLLGLHFHQTDEGFRLRNTVRGPQTTPVTCTPWFLAYCSPDKTQQQTHHLSSSSSEKHPVSPRDQGLRTGEAEDLTLLVAKSKNRSWRPATATSVGGKAQGRERVICGERRGTGAGGGLTWEAGCYNIRSGEEPERRICGAEVDQGQGQVQLVQSLDSPTFQEKGVSPSVICRPPASGGPC